MKKILTTKKVSQIDRSAIEDFHIPESVLIENAAIALCDELNLNISSKVQIICGRGNNGADGFAIARQLVNRGFKDVVCLKVYDRLGEECQRQMDMASLCGVAVLDFSKFEEESDMVIDALYGSGFHLPMDERGLEVLSKIESAKNIVSVDLPSGLSDTVPMDSKSVEAGSTITFGALKLCQLTPLGSAKVSKKEIPTVRNPGFPLKLLTGMETNLQLVELSDLKLENLSANAFKTTRGHVAVYSGCQRLCGAAVLAALSAYNTGSGLVTVLNDPGQGRFFDYPQLIMGYYSDDLLRFDSISFGNGMDIENPDSLMQLDKLLSADRPTVLDAGALRILGKVTLKPRRSPLVLTPHLGELKALAGVENLKGLSAQEYLGLLKALAVKYHAILVVKANVTWILSPEGQVRIFWGNLSSLGVAGSGDVLCGIITALLGQGYQALDAAVNGVLLHYLAGKLAYTNNRFYDSLTLSSFIGQAIMEVEK